MPKYDVAVIGAGLGGLAAAALLSAGNKKTIVIEPCPSLSVAVGVVEKNGFLFSTVPSLSYGFEPGGALQEFSAKLGIVQHAVVPSPCYQVALPDRRITIFPELEGTLEELRREFPREIDALSSCYQTLEKLAVRTRENRLMAWLARFRSAAGFMDKFRFSRELKAFFDVQALWFFQKPVEELSLQTLITLCSSPPRRIQGGVKKIGEQLCGVILQHGGEIQDQQTSWELVSSGHRVIGIKTDQGVVEADTVILNALPPQSRSLLLVGVREAVVPVGMSVDVLLLPEYSRVRNFLAVSLDPRHDNANEPPGSRSLTVSCASHQNAMEDKNACIEQLGTLMPFLSDFMLFAEEFDEAGGHAVLPADIAVTSHRSKDEAGLFHRTAHKNVFVIHDRRDAPLQVITAVRRSIDKLA